MDLKTANKELEKLENEYNYWLKQKESLLTLVMPKATDIKPEIIQGGKREDRALKYAELEDEGKIDDTLNYIHRKKQNLLTWIENELKIMLKYGEVESVIIQLKENNRVIDRATGKYRDMTWEEISKEVHWSKSFCRSVYRQYKRKRDIGE